MQHIPEHYELQALTQKQLNDVIRLHHFYLEGRVGGARAVLQYKDLSGLSFFKKDLTQADFTGSLLIGADLSESNFSSASFFACDMRNANLSHTNLSRADFRGAYVAGANLSGANMSGIDLREGKIMKRGKDGILEERQHSAGHNGRAVLSGAKMAETNMKGARAAAADFTDADLSGVDLSDSNLNGASFEGANLTNTDMSGASLEQVNMRHAIIAGTIMDSTEQKGLDISNTVSEQDMGKKLENLGKNLPELLEEHTLWVATVGERGRQLNLSGYDMRDVIDLKRFPLTAIMCENSNFISQDLCAAELQSGHFDRSDFRDCRMIEADLRAGSFRFCNFSRADLTGARMCPLEFQRDEKVMIQRIDMSNANLRYCKLRDADLRDAILMGADLSSADLRGADLRRADLTGALLKGAKLDGARLDEATIDLHGV